MRLLLLSLSIAVCCSGCTFWACDGGGPLSKEEAYSIYGRLPGGMSDEQKESAAMMLDKFRLGKVPTTDVAFLGLDDSQYGLIKGRRTTDPRGIMGEPLPIPIVGWWHYRTAIEYDRDGGNVQFFADDTLLCPPWPLMVLPIPCWTRGAQYAPATGQEVATGGMVGTPILPVICYVDGVTPVHMEPALKGAPVEYCVRNAFCIAFGALAWGRVNHRYYAQLLWVPIPLWRAD